MAFTEQFSGILNVKYGTAGASPSLVSKTLYTRVTGESAANDSEVALIPVYTSLIGVHSRLQFTPTLSNVRRTCAVYPTYGNFGSQTLMYSPSAGSGGYQLVHYIGGRVASNNTTLQCILSSQGVGFGGTSFIHFLTDEITLCGGEPPPDCCCADTATAY